MMQQFKAILCFFIENLISIYNCYTKIQNFIVNINYYQAVAYVSYYFGVLLTQSATGGKLQS